MRKEIEKLERKKFSTPLITENFLSLPRKAQEMFFDYLEKVDVSGLSYGPFHVCGFDYKVCKSPIEVIFAFAFDILKVKIFENGLFELEPQAEIMCNDKKYIADFLFDGGNFKLVIECDGHEFHKKTKAQVEKDNNREYDMKLSGYDVIRLSGSQIYNEPWTCAEKIYDYIIKKVNEV